MAAQALAADKMIVPNAGIILAMLAVVATVPTASASLLNSPWTSSRLDRPQLARPAWHSSAAFAAGFAARPLALKKGVETVCPAVRAPSVFGMATHHSS